MLSERGVMPYSFTPPVESHRINNLADDLLSLVPEGGKPLPVGATTIFCNGANLALFEPETPVAQTSPSGKRHVLNSIPLTRFDFTSTIVVPPAPTVTGVPQAPTGWVSKAVPVTDLNKVAKKLTERGPNYHDWVVSTGTPVPNGKIIVEPKPTALEMCGHILYHERQHAADVNWIIEKTFKPWADWLDILARGNIAISANDKGTFDWFIGGGSQSIYYGRYIFELSNEVSNHYHASDEGAAPIFTAVQYLQPQPSEIVLHVEVKPKLAVGNRGWNSPPHRCFRLYTVREFETGACTDIITNGYMAVPDWTLPAIALDQQWVDKFEKKDTKSSSKSSDDDSEEESFMGKFF